MNAIQVIRPMQSGHDDLPQVGNSATKLGVRADEVHYVDPGRQDEQSHVAPMKGPSVVTTLEALQRLPNFLHPFAARSRPLTFRQAARCACLPFELRNATFEPFAADQPLTDALLLREKPRRHFGYITPRAERPLEQFRNDVTESRHLWRKLEWTAVRKTINGLERY